MQPVNPIFLNDIYAELQQELVTLLKSLTPEDWYKPSVAGVWKVRDIVAHLLDSDVRRLSFQRDCAPQVSPETPITSDRDLVTFLNDLNAVWVKAAQRFSPQLLIQFHELTGTQVCELFAALDPFAPAMFGVAWAGKDVSENWFDIAREYTEKWHHQQQIRDAVGVPLLTQRRWLYPVLDTFLRGLPHTYRAVRAVNGTCITFAITGEAGGAWTLQRENGCWVLYEGEADAVTCQVRLDQDVAWRLLTKGLSPAQAVPLVEIVGQRALGQPLLNMLSVMA
ncbi:MAG: maleylpyruvate isomerase family mycothiol-dependent enzyme [Blastocatellia bacterium]